MQQLKIFGIRHHGSGSALRLLRALEEYKPDVIAIELPEESGSLIPLIDLQKTIPPVAFLFYNAQNPDQSIYLPLAIFSPEYQAIHFALQYGIPIHCIDLPAAVSLVHSNFTQDTESDLTKKQKSITRDPIAYLAKQAGYTDSERWWEHHFELWTDDSKVFDIICELMQELRRLSHGLDDQETLIREQIMRFKLRKLLAKKYQKIAVICGAWHAPVLDLHSLNSTKDEKIMDLKSEDIKSCIIPWTYKNLSLENGYSAGIRSPIWNEALFVDTASASSQFLVKAIHQLRKDGKNLSPASAIDAELLATNLALLRDLPTPGIEELLESAVCIFGKGIEDNLEWLREKILSGEVTGSVQLEEQSLPFIKSFHAGLKTLRLNRFWKEGHPEDLDLDLRKENHLRISQFLHFTLLVELQWSRPREVEINALGNFHEFWSFHWHPELEIDLIRIALFGNTFREASLKYIQKKLHGDIEIHRIAQYLDHALKSGIHEMLPLLSEKLSGIILNNRDVVQLSTMIRPLLSGLEYGSIYKTEIHFIKNVLDQLIPKIVISFPEAVNFVDYTKSKQLLQALIVVQLYFDKYKSNEELADLIALWKTQLQKMVVDELSSSLIKGKIWNLLLERQWTDREQFLQAFRLQFSLHSDIPHAAHWFEGFLYNQTAFYLMHPEIIHSLNQWLHSIEELHFKEHLPLLRRVFDQISSGERQRIFGIIASQEKNIPEQSTLRWVLDPARVEKVNSVLEKLH